MAKARRVRRADRPWPGLSDHAHADRGPCMLRPGEPGWGGSVRQSLGREPKRGFRGYERAVGCPGILDNRNGLRARRGFAAALESEWHQRQFRDPGLGCARDVRPPRGSGRFRDLHGAGSESRGFTTQPPDDPGVERGPRGQHHLLPRGPGNDADRCWYRPLYYSRLFGLGCHECNHVEFIRHD